MKVKSKKGFTLAEILVAGFVAAVALVAILGTLSNIALLNELNQEKTFAAMHGQYILEEIRDAAFTNLETDISNHNWDFNANQLSGNPYNFTGLNAENIVTTPVNTGNPLQIRLEVNWLDRRGTNRTYTLEMLRTD
ncbi:MAG: type II secretion system protein [Candidatus Omnitrophota bacterium]